MDTLTVARAFFDACDFGKGWDGCKQFCHPDASFETEAETLANIDTLAIYCDWMIDALEMLDKDVKVKIKAIAHDRDTDIVLIYGQKNCSIQAICITMPECGLHQSGYIHYSFLGSLEQIFFCAIYWTETPHQIH